MKTWTMPVVSFVGFALASSALAGNAGIDQIAPSSGGAARVKTAEVARRSSGGPTRTDTRQTDERSGTDGRAAGASGSMLAAICDFSGFAAGDRVESAYASGSSASGVRRPDLGVRFSGATVLNNFNGSGAPTPGIAYVAGGGAGRMTLQFEGGSEGLVARSMRFHYSAAVPLTVHAYASADASGEPLASFTVAANVAKAPYAVWQSRAIDFGFEARSAAIEGAANQWGIDNLSVMMMAPPQPRLSLRTADGPCVNYGDGIAMEAKLGGLSSQVVAGQMQLDWNPALYRLDGVSAGDPPFNVMYVVDQQAGSATILTSIPPGSVPPPPDGGSLCETPWRKVATGAPGGYEIAYDEHRSTTVLVSDGKTYEWSGTEWVMKSAGGPPARGAGALTYDPIGRRVLLFGGYQSSGVASDLWSWNGSTWTLLNDGQIPGRGDFAMCFDRVRNRLVVHGGYDLTQLLSDTCEWNPVTNTWRRVPDGPIGRRYAHRMEFDRNTGKSMLHGGFYFNNKGDTWTWDGASWVQIATNGPARYVFGMAFDSRRNEMVIHGGTTCCTEVEYPQTWRFRGGRWEVCGSSGPARGYMGMAYDSARDALIFSGGMGPSPAGRVSLPETWEFRPAPPELTVARMQFTVLGGTCDGHGSEVMFDAIGVLGTKFTDGLGNAIVPDLEGSRRFILDADAPVLTGVPADVAVNADAGAGGYAAVTLVPPSAQDACSPTISVGSSRSDGQPLSALWPVGTTTVTWSATDGCGRTTTANTAVTVRPLNSMEFRVYWTSPFGAGVSRAVSVSMRSSAGSIDRVASVVVGSDGWGRLRIDDLPIATYDCAAVEDSDRSLRRRISVRDGGRDWIGDDASLLLGDIIRDEVVDVLDWGAYVVRNPSSDLDSDGFIGNSDGNLILANFGRQGDGACGSSLVGPSEPVMAVSVADLVAMGLAELVGADLNGDGWLDAEDMTLRVAAD